MAEKISSEKKVSPTAIQLAFEKAGKLEGTSEKKMQLNAVVMDDEAIGRWEDEGGMVAAERSEPKVIPPELMKIYGDKKVPSRVLEMLDKLKGKAKREDYLAKLAVDESEKEKRSPTFSSQEKEAIISETRDRIETATKASATTEEKPFDPHSVPSVDDSNINAPHDMQKEIDELNIEKKSISHTELENFVREKLGKEAEITNLAITETPEGLQIQATLQHGMAGEINLKGIIVNNANTIGVRGLEVKAKRFEKKTRSKIEESLSGIGTTMKTYFEKQSGRQISNIQVDESGLSVEFEPPVAPTEPDGRVEPVLGAGPVQPENIPPKSEGPQAENRGKFKEVMAKAAEKFGWYTSSDEKLIRRNEELDALGEKIGGIDGERLFRKMGEWYNKRGFTTKLAVGAALGLGAAVGASASIPLAFACMSGIAAQRLAGFATMYLKFEKNSHQEKWGKEKAMLKAGIYTALLGLTMKEAIEYASETEAAHWAQAKVEGWLGSVFEHKEPPSKLPDWTKVPEHAPDASHPIAPAIIETPAAAAAAVEAIAMAPAIEMPTVEASSHGYEGMLKELIKKLPDNPPVDIDPNSDLAKLYEARANPESIGKAIHKLALDHKFFTDHGSVRIDTGAHMTVDTHTGNILFNGEVQAPTDAHFTPTIHPEAPAVASTLPSETVVTSDVVPGPDLTEAQDLAQQKIDIANEVVAQQPGTPSIEDSTVVHDSSGTVVRDGSGNPVHSGNYEQAVQMSNQFGLKIPVAESHIYADTGTELNVYGGSAAERAKIVLEYLTKNPDKIVFGADNSGKYCIPFHLVEGKVIEGPRMRTNSILGGLFSSWMKPPEPNNLAKLIK